MSNPKSILVIDDEESICFAFRRFFETRGWNVRVAACGADGLRSYREQHPSVIFLDIRLPDRSGLDLLEELKEAASSIIVITAYSSLETVVRAMKNRAFDYLVKPLDLDKALELAERVQQHRRAVASDESQPAGAGRRQNALVGDSHVMQELYKLIARASNASTAVLIAGATGTGKELVARAIHDFSSRCKKPFVAVNCGALPETLVESELFGSVRGAFTSADNDRPGRFELAHGGTLFLDEVGELPPSAQVKLLRVLDSQMVDRIGSSRSTRVDVRVLAATNRDLEREVEAGRFRADLYYRLAVVRIRAPLLREHKEDIPMLANHFLSLSNGDTGAPSALSSAAMSLLVSYDWPGNVRELRNAIEHATAVVPGHVIMPEHLPESLRQWSAAPDQEANEVHACVLRYVTKLADDTPGRYDRTVEQVERALLEFALRRSGGHLSEAAAYLGLHRNTLRNKIREYHLNASE